MKNTRILKTRIKTITNITLFLVCSLFSLSIAAQNNLVLKKTSKQNTNFEWEQLFEKKFPAANKRKSSYIDWWEPDTIYVRRTTNTYYREICTYNQQSYMQTQLYQVWDGGWVNFDLYTFTYDENNNMLTQLYQEWQDGWVNAELYTYTYNANNSMLTSLSQTWDGAWVNSSNYTYTYDANNNLIIGLDQSWQNNSWVNTFRSTYTYDENNNMLTLLFQEWLDNDWNNKLKYTMTYDAGNNMQTKTYQIWDGDWINSYKYTFTHNANNILVSELYQNWQGDWVNSSKSDYTYDENNNLVSELNQNWQDDWVNSSKYTYTYDINNNLLTDLYQKWEGNWVNDSKSDFTYDENNNCTLAERSGWISGSWQQSDGSLYLYYNNMKVWRQYYNCYKVTASYAYYSVLQNNDDNLLNMLPNISIYPNPTCNSFVVDTEGEINVKLYNMSGKEVLSKNANGKTVINISHLPNGIYNVQIFLGNKIVGYSKIVKQ
ncbi:MAG: T9SS type A sorting domain-containing protein [Bacteroidales bacterium]|jgi:hypothetical protein